MLFNRDNSSLGNAIREFMRDFDKLLDTTVAVPFSKLPKDEQARWLKRDREIHPSSFPYCGLRDAYERLQRRDGRDFFVHRKFDDDYYLNVGTIAHSALQLWLGRGKKLIGNWKCMKCEHLHLARTKPKVCKGKACTSDGFDYEELGGKWKKWTYWHSDGLFRDSRGRYWVIDYKTSYVNAIKEHRQTGTKYPYANNKVQIEAYCNLLEDKLGIKISGWILVYIARDFPRFFREAVGGKFTDERREAIRAHMKTTEKVFPIVLEASKPEHFKTLRKDKLCDSKKYYKEKIHSEYSPCPLYKHCFDKEKLMPKVEKEIRRWASKSETSDSSSNS